MEKQEVEKNDIEVMDKEEILTSALEELAGKMLPEEGNTAKERGLNSVRSVTNIMLEESEFRWNIKLRDDAIKLESRLRKEIEEKKGITNKEKDDIIWEVVNYEKQEKAKIGILEKITEKIDIGEELEEDEIKKIIEQSPDKKYLKTQDILKQASFIKEAKKTIGLMHPETKNSLIKYILSGKDVFKLTEFFEEYSIQKQIDNVIKNKDFEKNKQSPEEKEREALLEIGHFFLRTRKTDLKYIKEIAEKEDLPETTFKEKAKQLTNLLNQPHTNPDKLDKIVDNLLYREKKKAEEENEIKMQYLENIANRYKEINNLELAQLANEYKIPLSVVKNEAQILIRKINESKKKGENKKNNEIIQELIYEQRN